MSNTVVRTNVLAINSHRNLGLVGNQQARASARLSSGFRINSAADDAAGLAISEGMRAQIRGMNQASRNAQDGISLIQTAEGYMQTITELSQRMRELAVQGANDTNSDQQREFIAGEMGQIMSEMERIWDTSTFNGQNVFSGGFSPLVIRSNNADASLRATENATRETAANNLRNAAAANLNAINAVNHHIENLRTFNNAVQSILAGGANFNVDGTADITDLFALAGGPIGGFANEGAVADAAAAVANALADTLVTGLVTEVGALNTANQVTTGQRGFIENPSVAGFATFVATDLDADTNLKDVADAVSDMLDRITDIRDAISGFAAGSAGGGADGLLTGSLFLQVGPDGATVPGQGHSLDVEAQLGGAVGVVATGIGVLRGELGGQRGDFLDPGQMNLNDHASFSRFTASVNNLLDNEVNLLRAGLGAIQNRLEFTIENLDIAAENMSAAESRIRDADMAQEMMRLTQANVLQQAATAMLAQANQAPQSILQLLG